MAIDPFREHPQAFGYLGEPDDGQAGPLLDWRGTLIGRYRIVSSKKVESHLGTHVHLVEALIRGRKFTGHSFGTGMTWEGRAL